MTDPLPAELRNELEDMAANRSDYLGGWARKWVGEYPKPTPDRFHVHAKTLRNIADDLEATTSGSERTVAELRRIAYDMDSEVES